LKVVLSFLSLLRYKMEKNNTFCDKLIKIVENFERIQGLDVLAEESQPSFLGTSYWVKCRQSELMQ
jgi:hypothetical protein